MFERSPRSGFASPTPLEPNFYDRSRGRVRRARLRCHLGLETSEFVLEPLGPEHNELDYDAWASSMEHIAATPGYPDGSWPREMTRDENRADLQRHADDFRTRKGFTYTVLDPASRDVIGCVCIYPLRDSDYDACALSWVQESHAPGYSALARRE
jgi:hypothetical protein